MLDVTVGSNPFRELECGIFLNVVLQISLQVERHFQSSSQLAGPLTPAGQIGIGAFGNPQAALEASVLVHNVTRIAQVMYKIAETSTDSTKMRFHGFI